MIGYLLSIYGTFQALGTFVYPYVKEKLGLFYTGASGGFLFGISTISIFFCTQIPFFFIIMSANGFGSGIVQPSLPEYLTVISPEGKALEYVSLYSLLINVAILIYSQVTLLYVYSTFTTFLVSGLMSILQCILMLRMM